MPKTARKVPLLLVIALLALMAGIPSVASAQAGGAPGGPSAAMSLLSTGSQVGINSPLSVKTAFSGPVSGFAVDDVPVVNGVTVNSPVIHEAAKEPGMRYGLVPGQIRCTVAMVETHHRVSSPVMLDLLPGVPEQDHAARLTTRNLNRADEPIVPEGIVRLADGTGAGNNFVSLPPTAQSPGPMGPSAVETDRAALVALYEATDGGNWARNTNWLSSQPMGDWYGVVTNDSGRVTEIGLPQNLLAGELPSEVSDLTELTRLDLRRNELIGEITDDLDDLINLDSLSLANNLLSGEIPAELGNLPNLESLSLENNQLDGDIPTGLGNLSALESLSLGNNQFSGTIPLEIGDLINLRWLSIGGNQMSGEIPDELGNLANLTYLNLRYNRLSGQIPAGLSGLTRLTHLDLSRNRLNGQIPSAMGHLTNLELLALRGNQFTGCIPVELRDVAINDLDEMGLPDCGGLTVVMSIPPGGVQVRIDSPIAVTATFSEPVTGFSVDDASVASGYASNFAGSGGGAAYTFDVTPNAIGEVTVDISAGAAEDAEGNVNMAARLSLGIPYDDDNDDGISKREAIAAVRDYFSGAITKAQTIAVIRLYFRPLG